MKNKLIIMSGCPGSGKSTFAKEYFPNAKYVSRDAIRFGIVREDEEYFSKEDEVFRRFIEEINEGMRESVDVVADATHLNEKSRAKLLYNLKLNKDKYKVTVVYLKTSLATCIERNENRKGTRAYVPKDIIKRMYFSCKAPNLEECGGLIDEIVTVN